MPDQTLIYPAPAFAIAAFEASMPVLSFSIDGNILQANPHYCEMSGYRRDELEGRPMSILLDRRGNGAAAQADLIARLRQGKPVLEGAALRRSDGTPFWILAINIPVLDAAGNVTAAVSYAMDTTRFEQERQDAQARLNAISRSQAVIQFTPTGEVVWANDNFLQLMGYSLEEVKGRHHRIFCPPEFVNSPEYRQQWEDLANGGFRRIEDRRVTRTGEEVWIAGSYNALLDSDGKTVGVIKCATDVTSRYRTINAMVKGLNGLARGDLTTRMTGEMICEFTSVRDTFNTSLTALEELVDDLRRRAEAMNLEASDIARGASDVSRRGESQAAALEETAAAVEEISGNITKTSEAARDADTAAREALNIVLKGVDVVDQAIAAIERIDAHTKQMGEFTRVIEGFAFQTNLLSINAAVEAARAGEVGRGFAVVANEVRNLAQQSAKASQNIAELIGKSETEVRSGVKLVRDAGESLEHIRSAVTGVVENITGIALATTEQSQGVREVSEALSQLDGVNQANLAMSEQFAASAAGLSGQVEDVSAMIVNGGAISGHAAE